MVDRKSWSCESRSGRQHRCRRRTRRRGTRAPAWRVDRPTTSGCATSAREAAAGNAELPPEDDAVEMASAAQLLDSVAEAGPNYTLLRSKETKAKRRKRK